MIAMMIAKSSISRKTMLMTCVTPGGCRLMPSGTFFRHWNISIIERNWSCSFVLCYKVAFFGMIVAHMASGVHALIIFEWF